MAERRTETLIVGAGLAGLACAHHLDGRDHLIVEKDDRPGGKAVTDSRDGWHFDVTGHWLHMRDAEIKRFVYAHTGAENWVEVVRKSHVFSHGVYTQYPFQSNVYGLPVPVQKDCIKGLVEAMYNPTVTGEPATFEEWVLKYMGRGIADHFMIPYNHKLWTLHPRDMTPLWCQIYVPKPTLDELLDGALSAPERRIGYNATFVYPKHGGIGFMADGLARALPQAPLYDTAIASLSLGDKAARLTNGDTVRFEHVVSSMPLKELAAITTDLPGELRAAADRLAFQSVAYFNVALKRPPGGVHTHWTYFPEPEFVFYRVGYPSNAVETTAPPGKGSAYVEISFRGALFDTPENLWRRTVEGLTKARVIDGPEDVAWHEFKVVPCAYVLFDKHYDDSVPVLRAHYEAHGVHSVGRYGRWTYNSMETALIDGRDAARRIAAGRGAA